MSDFYSSRPHSWVVYVELLLFFIKNRSCPCMGEVFIKKDEEACHCIPDFCLSLISCFKFSPSVNWIQCHVVHHTIKILCNFSYSCAALIIVQFLYWNVDSASLLKGRRSWKESGESCEKWRLNNEGDGTNKSTRDKSIQYFEGRNKLDKCNFKAEKS